MKDYGFAALEEEPDLVLWVVCMTPLRYSVILECLDGVLRVSPSKQEGRGWQDEGGKKDEGGKTRVATVVLHYELVPEDSLQ